MIQGVYWHNSRNEWCRMQGAGCMLQGEKTIHIMKKAIQILYLGLMLFSAGCVTLYKPNTINSPLLKEKGDLNTSASIGVSGCGLFNLQASYAISNHAGLMVDGMYHNRHNEIDDFSVENLNMFFGEAGAGYFTRFGTEKSGLFQFYGGGGYGITNDKITNSNQPNPEVSAKYFNIFIQPGVALTSDYFDIAFDLRANYVRLFNIHAYLYDQFAWWNTDFNYYSGATLDFMNLEPVVTIKAGGEKLKGIFQLGVIIPTINSRSYFNVNNASLFVAPLIKFSLGVNYSFGRK